MSQRTLEVRNEGESPPRPPARCCRSAPVDLSTGRWPDRCRGIGDDSVLLPNALQYLGGGASGRLLAPQATAPLDTRPHFARLSWDAPKPKKMHVATATETPVPCPRSHAGGDVPTGARAVQVPAPAPADRTPADVVAHDPERWINTPMSPASTDALISRTPLSNRRKEEGPIWGP